MSTIISTSGNISIFDAIGGVNYPNISKLNISGSAVITNPSAGTIAINIAGGVPYTGATSNVNLGAFSLTGAGLTSTAGITVSGGIVNIANPPNTANLKQGNTTYGIDSSGFAYIACAGNGISFLNQAITLSIAKISTNSWFNGKMFIGSATIPTAKLHIAAGTSAAGSAPIKLTAGTNMTTPENGAFEFNGTNLFFTVGGVRKTVTLV